MNNYIIDPRVFYWINTLHSIRDACEVISVVLGLSCFALCIGWVYNRFMAVDYKDNEAYAKLCRKWAIITGIVGLILTCITIFLPSKSTSIEILVAKTATFPNVQWTVDQVKEAVDYIVNAIKGIK